MSYDKDKRIPEQNGTNHPDEDERREAIRLFGALSGVDEKYLEASETPVVKTRILRWRSAGKVMAAMLCVLVLGAGYIGLRGADMQLKGGSWNGNSAAPQMASDTAINFTGECAESKLESQAAKSYSGNSSDESAEGSAYAVTESEVSDERIWEEKYSEGTSQEKADNGAGNSDAELTVKNLSWIMEQAEAFTKIKEMVAMPLQQSGSASEKENGYRVMTEGEIADLPHVGDLFPAEWPSEGYLALLCGREEAPQSYYLLWQYSEEENLEEEDFFIIVVDYLGKNLSPTPVAGANMTMTSGLTREWLETQVFSEQTEGRDTRKPYGSFSVLCRSDDGESVLLRFSGCADTEELWNTLQSMPGLK